MLNLVNRKTRMVLAFTLIIGAITTTTSTPKVIGAAESKCQVLVCDENGACYHKVIPCPKL